jgi:hypothetical protein
MFETVIAKIVIEVFAPIIATAFSAIAAQLLLRRRRKTEDSLARDQASKLAEAYKLEGDANRASVFLEITKRLPPDQQSVDRLAATLEKLVSEVDTRSGKAPEEFSAVEGLISSYHEQALSQARVQFWFSVVAATVGFLWILAAGMDIRPDQLGTILKTTPGIVMDAVAFLFLKQAAETRQRATELYDRLRTDKQSSEAMKLVASIEDPIIRSAVQAQIALHKAGLAPTPIDIMKFPVTVSRGTPNPPAAN